jgi:hypothetical protein
VRTTRRRSRTTPHDFTARMLHDPPALASVA